MALSIGVVLASYRLSTIGEPLGGKLTLPDRVGRCHLPIQRDVLPRERAASSTPGTLRGLDHPLARMMTKENGGAAARSTAAEFLPDPLAMLAERRHRAVLP